MKHAPNVDLRNQLSDLGMSQADLARAADVPPTTVNRWATGKRPIPGIVWSYLDLKRQLREIAETASKAAARDTKAAK